jgi:hypothetical protein
MVAARGDEGVGAERGMGCEDKPLGLPLIRNRPFSFFPWFSFSFIFAEFCSLRHFEVSNSGLIKNLEFGSSFLEFFISIFLNFKIHRPVYLKPIKPIRTSFSGFQKIDRFSTGFSIHGAHRSGVFLLFTAPVPVLISSVMDRLRIQPSALA